MEKINKIKYWFRSLKHVKSIKDALDMGLVWRYNIYGDPINIYNCRSVWSDEYGNLYRCQELYDEEKNIELRLYKINKIKDKLKINKIWKRN